MSVWEYKVISSGKGGFATPALLETFLNQLGKDEWEIIRFQSLPDNPLAFTGLARRPTQRDWSIEDAAAAAARAEADKLRAEFAAKFKEGGGGHGPGEDKPESIAAEKTEAKDDIRRLRDTESDLDPDAPDENGEGDDWDKLSSEDELPTFFEAIRPHMRRNQRGPGLAVGVDYLAKKWDLTEKEVLGALQECGLAIPDDDDADPVYVEYDGDLFWVNANRRGELWINTKEKPRPKFRIAQGTPVAPEATEGAEAPAAGETENHGGRRERDRDRDRDRDRGRRRERQEEHAASSVPPLEPGQPLPAGPELLERLAPMMRRNRRGRGISGSTSFLSRALKLQEADLIAAFAALGLAVPAGPEDKPAPVEIGEHVWWINHDQRGGVWINGDDKGAPKEGEAPAGAATDNPEVPPPAVPAAEASAPASASGAPLAAVRLLLTPTKTGGFSGEVCQLAETLGKNAEEFLNALIGSGLKVPEKPREKPVFVEHAGEIFWLNRNAKDELWLNAKASKFSDGGRKPRKGKEKDGDEADEGSESDS